MDWDKDKANGKEVVDWEQKKPDFKGCREDADCWMCVGDFSHCSGAHESDPRDCQNEPETCQCLTMLKESEPGYNTKEDGYSECDWDYFMRVMSIDKDEDEEWYNCNTKEMWTKAKGEWCCREKQIGCGEQGEGQREG